MNRIQLKPFDQAVRTNVYHYDIYFGVKAGTKICITILMDIINLFVTCATRAAITIKLFWKPSFEWRPTVLTNMVYAIQSRQRNYRKKLSKYNDIYKRKGRIARVKIGWNGEKKNVQFSFVLILWKFLLRSASLPVGCFYHTVCSLVLML